MKDEAKNENELR